MRHIERLLSLFFKATEKVIEVFFGDLPARGAELEASENKRSKTELKQ